MGRSAKELKARKRRETRKKAGRTAAQQAAADHKNMEDDHGTDLTNYHRNRHSGAHISRAQREAHDEARGNPGTDYKGAGIKKKKKKKKK